jgi:peptidoglycan/LPS O-acetylase OafA/YrhL
MERLYTLQGLRGLAVLGVVLFHLMSVEARFSGGDSLLPGFVISFQLGVDLFFVISGYVMVLVSRGRFQQRIEAQRFLFNRFARIYPTYWLYFFITLAVYLLQPALVNSGHGPSNLLMSFLLLPSDKVLLVMVAWSLVFELWFYVVFSGFLLLRERSLPALLAFWAAGIVAFNAAFDWQDQGPALQIMLHPYALEFIIGAPLSLFLQGRHSERLPTPALWTLLGAAVLVGLPLLGWLRIHETQGLSRMITVGVTFGAIVLTLALLERRGNLTTPAWLVALGDMSYTVYLSHLLVIGVMGRLWAQLGAWPQSLLDNLVVIALTLAATVCYGWVGYHWFEKPVLDRANALSKRRFKTGAPAVVR